MNDSIKRVYASILVFERVCEVSEFELWLKSKHGIAIDKKILHGYKFFIDAAFSHFAMALVEDNSFGLTESELLSRAISSVFPLNKIPIQGKSVCEKTVLLKNIFIEFKPIRNAKNSTILNNLLPNFVQKFIKPIKKEIDNNLICKKGYKGNEVLKLVWCYELYTYFNQIVNNGPVAYDSVLYDTYLLDESKLESCLQGYAYTLQFLWHKLIGDKEFNITSLNGMNTSQSWKKYFTYSTARKNASEYVKLMSEHFNLEEQTCLDSYYYRIQKEIVRPLEFIYKIDITHTDTLYKINTLKFNNKKIIFKQLLGKSKLNDPKLRSEDKLDMLFLWYKIHIISANTEPLHVGVSSFLSNLFGAVELRKRNKNRKFEKVKVCKIVTSVGRKKNEYSYGVLIDLATATYNNYGWIIYHKCCSDYSGYSSGEYKLAEKCISELLKSNLIELRELKLKNIDLTKYVESKFHQNGSIEISNSKEQILSIKDDLNLQKGKANEMRGVLFEMLCFYLAQQYYEKQGYSVKWSGMNQKKEDIEIFDSEKLVVVECKINLDNCDSKYFENIIQRKLKSYNYKTKNLELWVWHEPKRDYLELLNQGIKINVLSKQRRDLMPFLNHVNLDVLGRLLG